MLLFVSSSFCFLFLFLSFFPFRFSPVISFSFFPLMFLSFFCPLILCSLIIFHLLNPLLFLCLSSPSLYFFSRLSFLPSLFYFLSSISLFFNSQNPFSLFFPSVRSLLLPKMSFPSLFFSWSNHGIGGARATLPPSSHWDRVRCLRRPLCSCSRSMTLLSFYYGGRL